MKLLLIVITLNIRYHFAIYLQDHRVRYYNVQYLGNSADGQIELGGLDEFAEIVCILFNLVILISGQNELGFLTNMTFRFTSSSRKE